MHHAERTAWDENILALWIGIVTCGARGGNCTRSGSNLVLYCIGQESQMTGCITFGFSIAMAKMQCPRGSNLQATVAFANRPWNYPR
ncbi:hypothetical protein RSOLAG22IIIB_01212 [Rhizoctonia solani]|uniref:Uncharacterized protein n=1 Tax=Rhizoctonia solani TaxID=456999 RepID=A0A0K6G4Z6_9AGAM|nr:hypothetical protein RSOLAG22IIIB_01212 [Rhizoctonia solani]